MDLNDLRSVRIQGKDKKWYDCKPFVSKVRGGQAVIYAAPDGSEIKREPLARYVAREELTERKQCFEASESDKAVWLVYCVQYVAEELGKSVSDAVELLDKNGLIEWLLLGYGSFHSNTFEYVAEKVTRKLEGMKANE